MRTAQVNMLMEEKAACLGSVEFSLVTGWILVGGDKRRKEHWYKVILLNEVHYEEL